MAKEEDSACTYKHMHKGSSAGAFGGVYGLAFVGVAVYYIQQSDGFLMALVGVLKAIVWPALLIYKVFTMLGM